MSRFRRDRREDNPRREERRRGSFSQRRQGTTRSETRRSETRRPRAPDFTYQKNNPISQPRRNRYPEGALPDIQIPDRSLELVSSGNGERIKDIILALNKGDTDEYLSFDEVIELIQSSEQIEKEQEILYIGSGVFAIVEYEQRKEGKHMHIVKKIEFETQREVREWRSCLLYKINVVYIDETEPLSSLYTQQEKDSFSEFNSG